jgi:hypothetical protein
MATSDGPVHPRTSPELVMAELVVLVVSRTESLLEPISLRPGIEYARAVPSPNTPTRATPRPMESVTAAESQKTLSHSLCAPLAVAGLKIRASVCVAADMLALDPA